MDKTDESTIHKTDKRGVADNLYGLIAANIFMVALIVLIIVGTAKLVPLLGNASSDIDRQIAYVNGEYLYYVKDMTAPEPKPVIISEIKNKMTDNVSFSDIIAFSQDGRYLYFMNDISASGVGNLCRIPTSSIRNDENINKGCIEVIQKGIKDYSFVSEEFPGVVLAETQKNDLCLYDGSKNVIIAKNCVDHKLSPNGVRVYYHTKTGDVGVYNIRKKTTGLLAAGVKNLWELNTGDMYYTVKHDDATDICMIDVSEQKTVQVVTGCVFMSGCDEKSDEICYVTDRETELSLYDMVDDLWTEEDYSTALAAEYYMSDSLYDVFEVMGLKSRRYYKKHPKKLEKLYDELPDAHEICNIKGDYKYYKKDTEGDEQYFVYDVKGDKWRLFDIDSYENAVKRQELKTKLEGGTYSYREYAVNLRNKNGETTVIAESVSPEDVWYIRKGLVFFKKAGLPVKISMDDIEDVSDVYTYYEGYGYEIYDEMLYATASQTGNIKIDGDLFDIDQQEDSDRFAVYSFDSEQLSFKNAYYYDFVNGNLTEKQIVPPCCGKGAWSAEGFYFSTQNCLYVINDGVTSPVFTGVEPNVYRYEYGLYLVLKPGDDNKDTLFLVTAGGEWVEVADVDPSADCTYVYDDQIVVLSGGELTVFLGGDKECTKLSEDVTAYTCFGIKPEFVLTEGFY